jgi:DNA-directed RNA polymerase subunit M/transcription elongation factor TFIIS
MSKWRPYSKKTAAELGLDEIRHIAYGSPLICRKDGSKRVIQKMETLSDDAARIATDHMLAWLQEKRELVSLCLKEMKRMQKHSLDLLSSMFEIGEDKSSEILLVHSSSMAGFSPLAYRREFNITDAESYFKLATMSPPGLLSLLVSFFSSSDPESLVSYIKNGISWPACLQHMRDGMQEPIKEVFSAEQEEVASLIRTSLQCSCGSYETSSIIVIKTRSADEAFSFAFRCYSCNALTTV